MRSAVEVSLRGEGINSSAVILDFFLRLQSINRDVLLTF